MKLAKQRIPEDVEGQAVSLLPEDPEDMVTPAAAPPPP